MNKATSDFYQTAGYKDGLNSKCKSCFSSYKSEWKKKNREEIRRKDSEYYFKNKKKINEYSRWHSLKKKYGLSIGEYNQMVAKQNNSCAICQQPRSAFKNNLVVDHCHSSGKIRGLLCDPCNVYLGHYENRVKTGWKMFDNYLREL
jgi:hypothetical protein